MIGERVLAAIFPPSASSRQTKVFEIDFHAIPLTGRCASCQDRESNLIHRPAAIRAARWPLPADWPGGLPGLAVLEFCHPILHSAHLFNLANH